MNYIIRDDKEHETTAPKVKVIAPRKKFQPSYNDRQNRKIRVGAYCRVSTDSDEQELSYETQCEYYENYIGSHENWELVAIYSDEGITGTSTNKRSDFMRMIDDARAGKLDMIITKSITRFARNTVDSLMYLRILKEYNVDVYFEVENVHSLEANEMLLTILSSVAQQSSEDKSESIKWGYQRQFEKGKVYAANMYGYKSNRGTLDIIEEEAEVVREIFSKYLSGMSESKIARYLTENKVPKKNGSTKWDSGTIGRMLQNEKYSGDALLKKTFSIDFLHKKRYKNEGQKKMYFVENSHPAIVTKEVFKAAQVERTKRNMKSNDEKDVEAAKNMMFKNITQDNWVWNVAWWNDPVYLGQYPKEGLEALAAYLPEITSEDMELIHQPLDFIGMNIYNGQMVSADDQTSWKLEERYIGFPQTGMKWPITPEVLYWAPKFLCERYKKPIYITENGLASPDMIAADGKIHDENRIAFLDQYLHYYRKASDEDIPVAGYFVWSLMDNFEWAFGYTERFGIVYVDYTSQERTIKESGKWYKKVIGSNGEIIK